MRRRGSFFSCIIYMVWAAIVAAGCNKVEYHPYDGKVSGPTGINAAAIRAIEDSCRHRDSICFAVISDTQRHYSETAALVKAINAMEGVDFVVNLGDLTDFGETKEFEWMRGELEKLRVPYVCLLGNHDCLGTGKHVFRKIFGDPDFAFTAGPTRFVCLNTNSREYGSDAAVPDFGFISSQADNYPSASALNTVVAMHAPPYSEQFDSGSEEVFEREISRFPNLLFCLHGHNHHTTAEELFSDGIVYYGCANAARRSMLVFMVGKNSYTRYVVEI